MEHFFMKKGNVFYGHNEHRQSIGRTFYKSVHAEVNVICKALKNKRVFRINNKSLIPGIHKKIKKKSKILKTQTFRKGSLYVARVIGNNKIACSRPCINCQKYMYKYGIKKIKYTDIDEYGKPILTEMRINLK